jgi:hypothetical protein
VEYKLEGDTVIVSSDGGSGTHVFSIKQDAELAMQLIKTMLVETGPEMVVAVKVEMLHEFHDRYGVS